MVATHVKAIKQPVHKIKLRRTHTQHRKQIHEHYCRALVSAALNLLVPQDIELNSYSSVLNNNIDGSSRMKVTTINIADMEEERLHELEIKVEIFIQVCLFCGLRHVLRL